MTTAPSDDARLGRSSGPKGEAVVLTDISEHPALEEGPTWEQVLSAYSHHIAGYPIDAQMTVNLAVDR